MKLTSKAILDIDKIDPLSVAEKLTGCDYKNDEATTALGMMLHMQKGALMREEIAKVDDTQFSEPTEEYLRKVTKFGFEIVYQEPFMDGDKNECYYILFMKELGILLDFDTFTGSRNSGNIFYNWSPNDMRDRGDLTSSGRFYYPQRNGGHIGLFEKDLFTPFFIPGYPADAKWDLASQDYAEFKAIQGPIEADQQDLLRTALLCGKRTVWVGDHDCREAIITKIKAMYENGRFLTKWIDCPFHWLTHYMDHKQPSGPMDLEPYKTKTRIRMDRLPDYVRDCINNTYRKNEK